jgi:hypothetical protein
MRKYLIATFLCIVALQASAQPIESSIPPECRLLPEHKPNAGVAFQPGVDVGGRNVVSADINAPVTSIATDTIVVPLTVDLAKRMHGQNIAGLNMEGSIGYLEIHPDGRVSHDGQDWTSQVYVLCGKSAISSGGQEAGNIINSPTNNKVTLQENHEPTGAKTAN